MRKRSSGFFILIFISGVLVGGLLTWMYWHRHHNEMRNREAKVFADQLSLANRKASLLGILQHIVQVTADEARTHPLGVLSTNTINRIASLSYSLNSYSSLDSQSLQPIVPERGVLLMMLINIPMDTGSWRLILEKTSFAGADLTGVNLQAVDLRGANLQGADLEKANLEGAKLNNTNFRHARLWGANLNNAELGNADFSKADLSWAEVGAAKASQTKFNSAQMIAAKMKDIDLRNSDLQWANMTSAILIHATLDSANLFRSWLKGCLLDSASLRGCKLTLANLMGARLEYADLTGADLTGAVVMENNWLDQLQDWKITGGHTVLANYSMGIERATNPTLYKIEKRKQ